MWATRTSQCWQPHLLVSSHASTPWASCPGYASGGCTHNTRTLKFTPLTYTTKDKQISHSKKWGNTNLYWSVLLKSCLLCTGSRKSHLTTPTTPMPMPEFYSGAPSFIKNMSTAPETRAINASNNIVTVNQSIGNDCCTWQLVRSYALIRRLR